MCKNWKNGAKWLILRKSAWATSAGLRNGLRSQFVSKPARWLVIRQRHGPIARGPGGVAQASLRDRPKHFCAVL